MTKLDHKPGGNRKGNLSKGTDNQAFCLDFCFNCRRSYYPFVLYPLSPTANGLMLIPPNQRLHLGQHCIHHASCDQVIRVLPAPFFLTPSMRSTSWGKPPRNNTTHCFFFSFPSSSCSKGTAPAGAYSRLLGLHLTCHSLPFPRTFARSVLSLVSFHIRKYLLRQSFPLVS